MSFADMTRADRVAYFNDQGPKMDRAWAEFVAASEKFAAVAKSCGIFENPRMDATTYTDNILDAARNYMAEEVSDYLHP